MLARSQPFQPRLSRGPWLRFGLAGLLLAGLLYAVVFFDPDSVPVDPTEVGPPPAMVALPELDRNILAEARDATREQRLFLEAAPFGHLLEKAYDIVEEKARALGRPRHPVPIADLREGADSFRGRWLWYKGEVLDVTGPRRGNPVDGAGIYEATLKLENGDRVLFAFSKPPERGVAIGAWARAEGYFMKVRDLTFPEPVDGAPLLVGATLMLDYRDWGPVTELDPRVLAQIVDVQERDGQLENATDSWRRIDEDQREPLWHLAAFAREDAGRPLAEWRTHPALSTILEWRRFVRNDVPRGEPMRILGRLVHIRTIAAAPNPAGIDWWTEAWVQVRDLQGKTIPVWVPSKLDTPLGTDLEVRGYYLRRLAYESRKDEDTKYWTTLFVAAGLDRFVFDTGQRFRGLAVYLVGGSLFLIVLVWWGARRERHRSMRAEDALLERRRRRRQKSTEAAAPGAS